MAMREKTRQKIRATLIGLGLTEEGADRQIRLFTGTSTLEEKARWQELNVMDLEGHVLVDWGAKSHLDTEICLFELAWQGMIQRTVPETS